MTDHARQTAEGAARVSYGRLVAILSARSRDIAAAEDALSAAFLSALRTWPDKGVPANPDAWLLTAARNAMKNDHRHRAVIDASLADLSLFTPESEPMDSRLKLLFVCAHPAIDPAARTPPYAANRAGPRRRHHRGRFRDQPHRHVPAPCPRKDTHP